MSPRKLYGIVCDYCGVFIHEDSQRMMDVVKRQGKKRMLYYCGEVCLTKSKRGTW